MSILLLTISQQSCYSDDSPETIVDTEYETGMWFVGQLSSVGDARYVKGHIINSIQYAFVAAGSSGMSVANVTNGNSPILVSNYATNGFTKEVLIDTVNGSHYVFISDTLRGLYILNATIPATLVLDTNISYSGVNSIARKGSYIYVALSNNTVKVIDISQLPASVSEVASYNSVNPVKRIEIYNNTAYFVERGIGIELVNIANPLNPVQLSSIAPSGSCNDIKIANGIIYVADGSSGVSIINSVNPSQPYFVNTFDTETNVRSIDYSPNFLFIAEGSTGVEVLNVFNPVEPDYVGFYEPGNTCYSVNYFKAKVLVANGLGGLLILRF